MKEDRNELENNEIIDDLESAKKTTIIDDLAEENNYDVIYNTQQLQDDIEEELEYNKSNESNKKDDNMDSEELKKLDEQKNILENDISQQEENKAKLEEQIKFLSDAVDRDNQNNVSNNDVIQQNRISKIESLKNSIDDLNAKIEEKKIKINEISEKLKTIKPIQKEEEQNLESIIESINEKKEEKRKLEEEKDYFNNIINRDYNNNLSDDDKIQIARKNKVEKLDRQINNLDNEIKKLYLLHQKETLIKAIKRDEKNNIPEDDKIQLARKSKLEEIEKQLKNNEVASEEIEDGSQDKEKPESKPVLRATVKFIKEDEKTESNKDSKESIFKRAHNKMKNSRFVVALRNLIHNIAALKPGKKTEESRPGQVVVDTNKILKNLSEKEKSSKQFVPKQEIDHDRALNNVQNAEIPKEEEQEK